MIIYGFLFYIFAAMLLISAICVVSCKNPIYSALWLMASFFNATGLFMLLGAEFIAMILVIVYVGAVMVLFIFVVMTINIDIAVIKGSFLKYLPANLLLGITLIADLFLVIIKSMDRKNIIIAEPAILIPNADKITNTHAIGMVLYTDYIFPFLVSGLILLLAMIGAIVITMRSKNSSNKQNIITQISRKRKESVEIVKVEIGKGVKL